MLTDRTCSTCGYIQKDLIEAPVVFENKSLHCPSCNAKTFDKPDFQRIGYMRLEQSQSFKDRDNGLLDMVEDDEPKKHEHIMTVDQSVPSGAESTGNAKI